MTFVPTHELAAPHLCVDLTKLRRLARYTHLTSDGALVYALGRRSVDVIDPFASPPQLLAVRCLDGRTFFENPTQAPRWVHLTQVPQGLVIGPQGFVEQVGPASSASDNSPWLGGSAPDSGAVHASTTAGATGLRRGQRIIAVQGVAVTSIGDGAAVSSFIAECLDHGSAAAQQGRRQLPQRHQHQHQDDSKTTEIEQDEKTDPGPHQQPEDAVAAPPPRTPPSVSSTSPSPAAAVATPVVSLQVLPAPTLLAGGAGGAGDAGDSCGDSWGEGFPRDLVPDRDRKPGTCVVYTTGQQLVVLRGTTHALKDNPILPVLPPSMDVYDDVPLSAIPVGDPAIMHHRTLLPRHDSGTLAPRFLQAAQASSKRLLGERKPRFLPATSSTGYRHLGVQCDVCGVVPLVDNRYKDMDAYDYDLCDNCYRLDAGPTDHRFVLYHGIAAEPVVLPPRAVSSVTMEQYARASLPTGACYDARNDCVWFYFAGTGEVQQWRNGAALHGDCAVTFNALQATSTQQASGMDGGSGGGGGGGGGAGGGVAVAADLFAQRTTVSGMRLARTVLASMGRMARVLLSGNASATRAGGRGRTGTGKGGHRAEEACPSDVVPLPQGWVPMEVTGQPTPVYVKV